MASSFYNHSDDMDVQVSCVQLEKDAQECVMSLLALKHRSVTPDLCEQSEPAALGDQGKDPPLLEEFPQIPTESYLGESQLVLPQDRGLVPDALFVAMAQMKPCRLTQADRAGSYKRREIGFVGLCCKHCGGHPNVGRYFPDKPRSLAQTTTAQTIIKHCDSKCNFCPPFIRHAIRELQRIQCENEQNSGSRRPRYGGRKVFFERVWKRLHQQPFPEQQEEESSLEESESPPALDTEEEEENEVEEEHKSCRFGMLPTKKNLKRRMMGLDVSCKRSRVTAASKRKS